MTETKTEKIYRVWYRVRLGHYPLVGEFNVKTKKAKWEIDFEEIAENFIKVLGGAIKFDEIINTEEIKQSSQKTKP